MKISRLHIDGFAVEDYQTITKEDIAGGDLLLKGGNRSGKTLTINALLYALYGPRATLGIQPGRTSTVEIQFDNGHQLHRGGGGRSYDDGTEEVEKEAAEDLLEELIGPEDITTLQFVHSETDKLPLSRLSKPQLIQSIRQIIGSNLQQELEDYRDERDSLEQEIEQVRRTELAPVQRELEEIDIGQVESRLEKIEKLQSLIDTGRIEIIRDRLLENEELNEELQDLYDRKRTIEQELRKKDRQLREARRYTQEVNDLILNAIEELSCPVCDQVVAESTANHRLDRGKCPHCGQDRSLDDLKTNLRSRVESADDTVNQLEAGIEELKEEQAEIENEIDSIQASIPDLSDLNDLTKFTLEDNNYDIEAVAERTKNELEQHRAEVDRLNTQKQSLEEERDEIQDSLDEMDESLEQVTERIDELERDSFEEIVMSFQEKWSENYEALAGELGLEVRVEEDGQILLPGNGGPRKYSELSTGESRLLNLAFAHTVASVARENENSDDSFEVVVLDEPFANLEDDQRDSAIDFIRDTDIQYIIASSNESLQRHFDPHQVEGLQTMTVQLTWDDLDE
ncbi:ATPase AAA [Haloarcula hispanica N601]|uniref:ATPase AAA n=2 Tax=Haloarcula hispanica TaxID=51589 RepID=V5TR73_HALHI|nr:MULTISPECIES: SbcC/MukB-like Walker B domain-containing protein [Haloarcula]AEM58765.1 AAA ATPase [Haloarcula hispanica ATCC 33960]AHB67608.1 ATPase AAA [Haloarcula hispanica N601]KAA9401054.1 AAA family ATPase [Haloarcula sp. CBA1131]